MSQASSKVLDAAAIPISALERLFAQLNRPIVSEPLSHANHDNLVSNNDDDEMMKMT